MYVYMYVVSGETFVLRFFNTMFVIGNHKNFQKNLSCEDMPLMFLTLISSEQSELDEPVHILAYYSSCGPKRIEQLEMFLANIRDGRFLRAKNMVSKLNKLNLPIKWEHVARIAGKGVAPGRVHVARAMLEAGYVENLKQAFARYLFDGGPAYST